MVSESLPAPFLEVLLDLFDVQLALKVSLHPPLHVLLLIEGLLLQEGLNHLLRLVLLLLLIEINCSNEFIVFVSLLDVLQDLAPYCPCLPPHHFFIRVQHTQRPMHGFECLHLLEQLWVNLARWVFQNAFWALLSISRKDPLLELVFILLCEHLVNVQWLHIKLKLFAATLFILDS